MRTDIFKLGFLLVIFPVLFFGCKKEINDITPAQSTGTVKSMSDMKVSSAFDWKTTQNVNIQLTVPAKASLIIKSASGSVYCKALLQKSDVYQTNIVIPVYEKELNILINGVSNVFPIDDHKIVHSF